ncbi:MAG: hypothetical protein U9R43_16190 [Thermodesulfobacteriota bacterium]|nr:hypothetical protein [Thermodesulfobacteriota bacterium]
MTKIIENNKLPLDHYKATLENGLLVMKPFCSCGNSLDEDYFCDKCNKKCNCHQIVCDNEATLKLVKKYTRKSSQFSGFKIKLA